MKVRMITLSAGPDGARLPGKTYLVSAEEGKALIDGGYAVEVNSKDVAKAESPTSSAPRTASRPRGRTAAKSEAKDTDGDADGGAGVTDTDGDADDQESQA